MSRRSLLGGLAAIFLASAAILETQAPSHALSPGAPVVRMEVSARPIRNFRIGSGETRFGPLEFVGGLELVSRARDFGSMSAFRFMSPGRDFVGVADTGFWFFGRLARDGEGRPQGVEDFRMAPFVDAAGRPIGEKWNVDAEGLALRDGKAVVSFERAHRIAEFSLEPDNMRAPEREYDFLVPRNELRQNRGFETVTFAPPHGIHEGAMVAVTEKSLDRNGDIFAAIVEGPGKGIFKVRRVGEFDVTDGSFLPNGDLLLLERRYSISTGVAMRLRRIDGETIRAGAVADGPILLEADMRFQIDNMEGMDVWRREDGALVVSIVSDDNHSILQRNLYLEFVLHDE